VFIYSLLTLPVFSTLIRRIRYEDVTGFNGRRDIWERGLDWISTQGQGFITGNGYHGYYYLGIMDGLEQFWSRSEINLHMHSSSLEYFITLGLLGFVPLLLLMFIGYRHLGFLWKQGHPDGLLIGAILYLIIIFQVDNFTYITHFGSLLLFAMIGATCIKTPSDSSYETTQDIHSHPVI
jgi:O-antigen ligase